MSIKSDKWIRRMAAEHGMIEPFAPGQVKEPVAVGLHRHLGDVHTPQVVGELLASPALELLKPIPHAP